MNKIKLFAAALAIGALSFSCSSDDSENLLGGDFTAKWNPIKTVIKISGETFEEQYDSNQAGCDKDFVEFTEANTVNNVIYYDPAGAVTCAEDAEPIQEYTRTDNTLVVSGGQYGGTYEITKLTSSELRLEQTSTAGGGITTVTTIYFNKAAN
jgi:hypothetical protein